MLLAIILSGLTLLFFSTPFFLIRLFALCTSLIIIINRLKVVKRGVVFAFLLFIYQFSFILSPYWNAPKEPRLKIVFLVFLFLLLPLLAYYSAADINLFTPGVRQLTDRYPRGGFTTVRGVPDIHRGHLAGDLIAFVILAALLYAVNFIPLHADIPWRGDEDYHIGFTLDMWERVGKGLSYLLHPAIGGVVLGLFLLTCLIYLAKVLHFFQKPPRMVFRRDSSEVKFISNSSTVRGVLRTPRRCLKLKSAKLYYLITLSVYSLVTLFTFLIVYIFSKGMISDLVTHFTMQVLRYPNLQKWIGMILVFPFYYQEIALYRMIPFLSVVFLAWFLYIAFRRKNISTLLSFVFSITLVTVPLIYFYSSILYMEMIVVFLATVIIFDLDFLLTADYKQLPTKPSWYCLLLIAILKETTLFFLLPILVVRSVYQLFRTGLKTSFSEGPCLPAGRLPPRTAQATIHLRLGARARVTHSLSDIGGFDRGSILRFRVAIFLSEVKIWVLVLSLLLIYLFFRSFFSSFNLHSLQPAKLFYLPNYFIYVKALFIQLGLLLPISLSGIILLALARRWLQLAALLMLVMVNMALNITDVVSVLSYLGYSRLNILLVPVFIYCAYVVLSHLDRKKQLVLASFLFLSNLYFLPIHPDGTRLPNWGSPLIDTGEYTYPYDQAVKWLSKSDHNQNVLLAGHYYRVDGLRFYFGKYRYFPKMAEYYFAFERFDKEAEERFFSSLIADLNNVPNMRLVVLPDKIIYHSVNNIDLDKDKIYGGKFKIAQKISNSEHSIYVLTKNYNIY